MKITEQAIREAMKLAPGVAVTLGTLDEATRTRIAVVGSGLYTITQHAYTVTLTLQFAAHNPAIVGYPTRVTFELADMSKVEAMQAGVSALVDQLHREGKSDDAAKVFALMNLPCEDIETVYDALVSGMSKAQFIDSLTTEATPIRTENRPSTRDIPAADVEPANTRVRIGNPASAHLYNVGVNIGGGTSYIEVDAQNRAQARKVAEDNGYEVRDINMIG